MSQRASIGQLFVIAKRAERFSKPTREQIVNDRIRDALQEVNDCNRFGYVVSGVAIHVKHAVLLQT